MIILLRKKSVKWLLALLVAVIIISTVRSGYDRQITEDAEPTALVMAEVTAVPAEASAEENTPFTEGEPTEAVEPVDQTVDEGDSADMEAAAVEEAPAVQDDQTAIALRLERSQNRAQQVAQLESIIGNEQISETSRSEAEEKLLRLNDQSAMELQTETMLKTKGYEQAVVMIDHDKATVYITSRLEAADFDKIGDLVQTCTNFSLEQIIIIPKVV